MNPQTTTQRIYPGLLDSNLEFFNNHNNHNELMVLTNGAVFSFTELPIIHYERLKEKLYADERAVDMVRAWFPKSEVDQLKKFAQCRFGGLDFTPDIANGVMQDGEYWDCPFRGTCKGEGIVCRNLRYNDQELSGMEIKIMKLLSTTYTNEVIADILKVSLGQLHKLKQILYEKLGIQTKQEATNIAIRLNLI